MQRILQTFKKRSQEAAQFPLKTGRKSYYTVRGMSSALQGRRVENKIKRKGEQIRRTFTNINGTFVNGRDYSYYTPEGYESRGSIYSPTWIHTQANKSRARADEIYKQSQKKIEAWEEYRFKKLNEYYDRLRQQKTKLNANAQRFRNGARKFRATAAAI